MQASITCFAKHLGCLIAQTTVRPNAVVFSPPPCGFGPSVAHRLERLALRELVSQPTVERFDEGVLPGTGRRHRDRASTHVRQPLRQRRADELRSVVAANPRRCATSADDPGQHPSHIRSGRRRADRERQALPSIFVQQRQPLECSSVDRPIRDKIVRPNIVLEPRRLVGATVGAGTRFGSLSWFFCGETAFAGPSGSTDAGCVSGSRTTLGERAGRESAYSRSAGAVGLGGGRHGSKPARPGGADAHSEAWIALAATRDWRDAGRCHRLR